eukprot:jgi/Mesvir1/6473/Mv19547-RA.2
MQDENADADVLKREVASAVEAEAVGNEYADNERSLVLTLQALDVTCQPFLDNFMAGRVSLDELRVGPLSRVVPGDKWEGYLDILQYCRSERIEVLAMAPPPYVLRSVVGNGIESLDERDRQKYAPPKGGAYGADIGRRNGRNRGGGGYNAAASTSVLYAQTRAVMGYTNAGVIAAALRQHPRRTVLALVAESYAKFGTAGRGVPLWLKRVHPVADASQKVILLNPGRQPLLEPGEAPEADYLWYAAAVPCTENCFDRDRVAQAMSAVDSNKVLPKEITVGVERGVVSPELIERFHEPQSPLMEEALSRFQGLRERWLADPNFLLRLVVEESISISTTMLAEVQKRGDRFWDEIEYVTTDVVRGTVVDFFTVWLPAPTLSFREFTSGGAPRRRGPLSGVWEYFGKLPENVFQRPMAGERWGVGDRLLGLAFAGAKLFGVGLVASSSTVALTNLFIDLKERATERAGRASKGNGEASKGGDSDRKEGGLERKAEGGQGAAGAAMNGAAAATTTADGNIAVAAPAVAVAAGAAKGTGSDITPAHTAAASPSAVDGISPPSAYPPPAAAPPKKQRSPVFKTAFFYALYLSTSANLRYQLIAGGVEHWVADYWLIDKPAVGGFLSFAARTVNSFVGTAMWIDFSRYLGLQKAPPPAPKKPTSRKSKKGKGARGAAVAAGTAVTAAAAGMGVTTLAGAAGKQMDSRDNGAEAGDSELRPVTAPADSASLSEGDIMLKDVTELLAQEARVNKVAEERQDAAKAAAARAAKEEQESEDGGEEDEGFKGFLVSTLRWVGTKLVRENPLSRWTDHHAHDHHQAPSHGHDHDGPSHGPSVDHGHGHGSGEVAGGQTPRLPLPLQSHGVEGGEAGHAAADSNGHASTMPVSLEALPLAHGDDGTRAELSTIDNLEIVLAIRSGVKMEADGSSSTRLDSVALPTQEHVPSHPAS